MTEKECFGKMLNHNDCDKCDLKTKRECWIKTKEEIPFTS
jgi:hypothetical protein